MDSEKVPRSWKMLTIHTKMLWYFHLSNQFKISIKTPLPVVSLLSMRSLAMVNRTNSKTMTYLRVTHLICQFEANHSSIHLPNPLYHLWLLVCKRETILWQTLSILILMTMLMGFQTSQNSLAGTGMKYLRNFLILNQMKIKWKYTTISNNHMVANLIHLLQN